MDVKKSKSGRVFGRTCLIRGEEDKGRRAIIRQSRDNTRVAEIGPDGLATDETELVATADLVDVRDVATDEPSEGQSALVGERGTVTIPARIRRHLGLRPGTPVLFEEAGGSIVIRPAKIVPRDDVGPKLDEILAGITPENIHGEFDLGPDVGREAWAGDEDELSRRRDAVGRVDALRERLASKYGEMPDSGALIREDRDR